MPPDFVVPVPVSCPFCNGPLTRLRFLRELAGMDPGPFQLAHCARCEVGMLFDYEAPVSGTLGQDGPRTLDEIAQDASDGVYGSMRDLLEGMRPRPDFKIGKDGHPDVIGYYIEKYGVPTRAKIMLGLILLALLAGLAGAASVLLK